MAKAKIKRSASSKRWLTEHFDDPFVKQAQKEGWRSRAVYKLAEIQEKDRLIRPGDKVVDLGAAPGGWSQFAAQQVGERGHVYACDLLEMDAIPNVSFLQGDFREETVLNALLERMGGSANVVMSDMAPNMSGEDVVDQARSMYLVELALEMCCQVLGKDGRFVVKVFQGAGFDEYIKAVRARFATVKVRKPQASRARSREIYLVAGGFKLV